VEWGITTLRGVDIEVNVNESAQTIGVHPAGQTWRPLPALEPMEAYALSMVLSAVALKRIGSYNRRLYEQLVATARTLGVRAVAPDPGPDDAGGRVEAASPVCVAASPDRARTRGAAE
jgi:hypothetical protein